MIAKRIVELVATGEQCTKSRKCHREDGHAGGCQSVGVVVAKHIAAAVRKLVTRLKERWA